MEACPIPFKLCVDLLVHFGMEPWLMPNYLFSCKEIELACKGSQFRLFANICKVLAACLIGKLF